MHRLFWKIFLSFWAALILFAGAAMLTASHYLEQARLENVAMSPRARLLSHVSDAQRHRHDEQDGCEVVQEGRHNPRGQREEKHQSQRFATRQLSHP